MTGNNTAKQERMHIRLDTFAKQKLEKAASYQHKTLSDFVLTQALSSAEEVIQARDKLTLSESDWEVFMDALENPPQLNQRLQKALKKHQDSVINK